MGQEKEAEIIDVNEILQTFEREFKRHDDLSASVDWQDFARGFVRKEMKAGHDYRVWLNWFTSDIRRMEWAWKETPKTIRARWGMAFDNPKDTVSGGWATL